LKVGALASKEAREDPAQADLPLSPDSKYVLMYAGNEAKERGDPYIGSEHLLLGLLLQESGLAEIALGELGVTIAEVRKRLEDPPQHPEMT
jgi:ATP-dependent Clp protease ATP-binding subunit ClpC